MTSKKGKRSVFTERKVELAFDGSSEAEVQLGAEELHALQEKENIYRGKSWPRCVVIWIGRSIKKVFRGIHLGLIYLVYLIWAIFLLVLFLPAVIILFLPWTFFDSTRPWLFYNQRSKRKVTYAAGATSRSDEFRDAFAWVGKGIERHAPRGHRFSAFCKGRAWEIYEVLRECWRTVHRQGLQIASVIGAVFIIIYQVEMIAHDLSNDKITGFYDGIYGGPAKDDPKALLTEGDGLCPYGLGTGVAYWGDGLENLVWYGMYHGFLILLCLMLIADETFNVRMGCFAPQWSRMGNGYTIMFLVAATLSTSANWGWKKSIRLRYLVLVVIFMFGVYNVLHTTYRNRRHPLRLWTEPEWQDSKQRQDFRQRRPGDEPRYWTEKRQLEIGDHCWGYQKVDRKKWNYGEKQSATRKIYTKTYAETLNEFGQCGRRFWHGLPIDLPEFTEQDRIDVKRYSTFKNWKSFYGIHHWHPWRRWDKGVDSRTAAIERRKYTFQRACTFWFDVRRVFACACALAAFAVHIGLMWDVFALGHWTAYRDDYSNVAKDYSANGGPSDENCQYYTGTHMAIFPQPGVSPRKGGEWHRFLLAEADAKVWANMFWLGLWHVFILGMCVGVFCVAFTNNRVFGMHLPLPITLIGPRLSSVSIGWTLGFVATMQLGFFHSQAPIVQEITQYICYACLIAWLIYLAPNERLSNVYCRDPFWNKMSELAFEHMERKIFHKDVFDFAGEQPFVKRQITNEKLKS